MDITIPHLLRFLPMDESVRARAIKRLSSYTPDQKLALEKFCWMMFYELLGASVKYEFDRLMLDAKEGKRTLGTDAYQKVEEQVYMRFMRDLREQHEATSIDEIRGTLKQIVQKRLGKVVQPPSN